MPRLIRPTDQPQELEHAVAVYGNRGRLAVLRYLAHHGPALRTDIQAATAIATPTLGSHLTVLEEAGAITADLPPQRRRGRTLHYQLHATRTRHLLDVMHDYIFTNTSERR